MRPARSPVHTVGPTAEIRILIEARQCLALPDGSCVDRHHGDQRTRGDRCLGRPGGLGRAGAQGHAAAHSARSAQPSPALARCGTLPGRAGRPGPGSGRVRQDLASRAVASRKPRQRFDRALADGESGGRSAQAAAQPDRGVSRLRLPADVRPRPSRVGAARPGRRAYGMARRDRAVGARHRACPRRGRPPAAGVLRGPRLRAAEPAPEPAGPGRDARRDAGRAGRPGRLRPVRDGRLRPTCGSTWTRRSSWSGSGSGRTSTRASPSGCTRWPMAGPSASSSSSR